MRRGEKLDGCLQILDGEFVFLLATKDFPQHGEGAGPFRVGQLLLQHLEQPLAGSLYSLATFVLAVGQANLGAILVRSNL